MRLALGLSLAVALAGAAAPAGVAAPAPEPERDIQRWAVIVGINDYLHFDGVANGDLLGAVNDARSMADVLMARWGFPAENVLMLVDADASRASIEEALRNWLPSRVRPGDVALFFFAGHGSQVIDLDGDEDDGLDETITPWDVLPTSAENDITDDDLREWLAGIRTDELVVVLDACHSGTATRALSSSMRPRSLPRAAPNLPGTRGGDAATGSGMAAGEAGVLALAAAASHQVAMDAVFAPRGGTTPYAGGAFTTHLVRQLWRAEPGTTYRTVFQAAFEAMKAERFAQDAQIEGMADRPLFAVRPGEVTVLAAGEVAAEQVEGRVLLRAGPVQGVTVGSLYAMGGELVRVEDVTGTGAVAAPMGGGAGARGMAKLAAYVPDVPALRVSLGPLEPGVVAHLRHALPQRQFALVTDDQADLFVRPDADGARVLTAEGLPRLTVTGAGDALAGALAAALRQEWAAQRIAALDNPAPSFAVELAFVQGVQEFRQRDPLSFRVRSEREGYLTLLDLGTDGTVTVLYPNRFVPEGRIGAGQTLEIPTQAMPFRLRASGPEGWGMVRAVVTPRPLDLGEFDGPLLSNKEGAVLAETAAAALHQALAGLWTGSAPLGEAVPVDGWSTSIVNYRIVR